MKIFREKCPFFKNPAGQMSKIFETLSKALKGTIALFLNRQRGQKRRRRKGR